MGYSDSRLTVCLRRLSKLSLWVLVVTQLCSCRFHVLRIREGTPIDEKTYDSLQVQSTTMTESLDQLGAPSKIAHRSGDDYLVYEYGDEVDIGVRFRLPTPIGFYQHNILSLTDLSEQLNRVSLVFDEDGVLKGKAIQVSSAYQQEEEEEEEEESEGRDWKLKLNTRIAHSLALFGDGGESDYTDMFENGYRAGVDLGFEPVPVFTLLFGGGFSQFQGDKDQQGGVEISYDDLEMFDFHLGIRMTAPVEIFANFDDFEYVKRLLFDEKLNGPQGFRVYVQGTTGATISNNITVKVDGQRRGNFYDGSVLSSSSLETGVEYGWGWGLTYAGLTYYNVDAFDEGNSGLDDRADSFQTIMVTGGLETRF